MNTHTLTVEFTLTGALCVDAWQIENEVGMNCRLHYRVVNNEPVIERCEFDESRTPEPHWVPFVLPVPFRNELLKFARGDIKREIADRYWRQVEEDVA